MFYWKIHLRTNEGVNKWAQTHNFLRLGAILVLYDHNRGMSTALINAWAVPEVFILTGNLINEKSNRLNPARGHGQDRVRSGADSSRLAWSLSRSALVGFESNNKYEVRNAVGQNVFYAVEENDCLNRQCCGPLRPFSIHILDNFGQEVISVTRPLKCMSCFFPCCLQEVSGTALAQGFPLLLLNLEDLNTNLPHSWRCRLPPVTQWATSYNSGTRSPLNSSWPTSTTSRFWRSTGPSADGAASQRSTLRWVQPNSHIANTRPPLDVASGSVMLTSQ